MAVIKWPYWKLARIQRNFICYMLLMGTWPTHWKRVLFLKIIEQILDNASVAFLGICPRETNYYYYCCCCCCCYYYYLFVIALAGMLLSSKREWTINRHGLDRSQGHRNETSQAISEKTYKVSLFKYLSCNDQFIGMENKLIIAKS